MKPNENQKKVIETLALHVEWWTHTNDINSPSHWSLNDEWAISDEISEELVEKLEDNDLKQQIADKLSELLSLIRKIK